MAAFRKSFKKRFGGFKKRFSGGSSFRKSFSSFRRPRFRGGMMRTFSSFRSPVQFRGIPFSRQINSIMPLAIIGGVLYMFVPAVKNWVNGFFHKK